MARDTKSLWWLYSATVVVLMGLFLWMLLDSSVTDVTENDTTQQQAITE